MTATISLVPVRDVYDRQHLVDSEQLAGEQKMLRTYNPNGKPAQCRVIGGSAVDWQPIHLHRDNICPHDRTTWIERRFPDGSPDSYCPACCPR